MNIITIVAKKIPNPIQPESLKCGKVVVLALRVPLLLRFLGSFASNDLSYTIHVFSHCRAYAYSARHWV